MEKVYFWKACSNKDIILADLSRVNTQYLEDMGLPKNLCLERLSLMSDLESLLRYEEAY